MASLEMKFFRRKCRLHSFDYERNEEILEGVRVEPNEEKLRRYKSNWLRHATTMNIPKIMLNYKPTDDKYLEDL